MCSVAGLTSDANLLTNELRLIGQRYKYSYGESIPCEQLVSWLCDIKQLYTQSGGKRPFGVSILYMGWDKHYGFQLYQSDPSGETLSLLVLLMTVLFQGTMEAGRRPVSATTGTPLSRC